MEIIPLIKHSNKCIKDGMCHFAGCKEHITHFLRTINATCVPNIKISLNNVDQS